MKMKERIMRLFNLWIHIRWLKKINREADKYHKINSRLLRQQHIVNVYLAEYEKLYGFNLRGKGRIDI